MILKKKKGGLRKIITIEISFTTLRQQYIPYEKQVYKCTQERSAAKREQVICSPITSVRAPTVRADIVYRQESRKETNKKKN